MDPAKGAIRAQVYDETVHDWPGEIDFYRRLAARAKADGGSVLEVACGTGRVLTRLAQDGMRVTGFDVDTAMLEIARRKTAGNPDVTILEGDMRRFDLGETFRLAIVPGHAFQLLLTPDEQIDCLDCIRRHLAPGGLLVVHLDKPEIDWLGDVSRHLGGVFGSATDAFHAGSGNRIRISKSWSYDSSSQTATAITRYEEQDAGGNVIAQWDSEPVSLHCVFRFEMEHLLARASFNVEGVYGDFFRQALQDDSTEMIWLARRQPERWR